MCTLDMSTDVFLLCDEIVFVSLILSHLHMHSFNIDSFIQLFKTLA